MDTLDTHPFYMYDTTAAAVHKDHYVSSTNPYISTAPNSSQCLYGSHHPHYQHHHQHNHGKASTGLHSYAPGGFPLMEDTSLMDPAVFHQSAYSHMMPPSAHAHSQLSAPAAGASQWLQCAYEQQRAMSGAQQSKCGGREERREQQEEREEVKPRYSWLKQTKSRAGEWKRGWAGQCKTKGGRVEARLGRSV